MKIKSLKEQSKALFLNFQTNLFDNKWDKSDLKVSLAAHTVKGYSC